MKHSFSKIYRTTRLARYRVKSVFSKRAAYRLRTLQEAPDWRARGYNYGTILGHACVIPATGAVYLPVPKCATIAMNHMIADESPSDVQSIHRYTPSGVERLPDHGIALNDISPDAYRCFTVVRHPIDRFISAYSNQIATKKIQPLKKSLCAFLNCAHDAVLSVDDLIAYVTETATENIDVHVCPQWSCCGAGRIPFEMVGRVESLDRDVPAFIEAGLIAPEKLARLEVRNATSAHALHDLSQSQKAAISRLYAHDFKMFGY